METAVQPQICHPNPETDRLGTCLRHTLGHNQPQSSKGAGERRGEEGVSKKVPGLCTLKNAMSEGGHYFMVVQVLWLVKRAVTDGNEARDDNRPIKGNLHCAQE